MTNYLRVLYQMMRYHSTYDIEKALRRQLWRGMEIGRKQVNQRPHCDFHVGQPLVVIAPGVFSCPQCRAITTELTPTVQLQPYKQRPTVQLQPDVERNTDRVKLPAQAYSQARRSGAGPHTAVSAAIPKKGGNDEYKS